MSLVICRPYNFIISFRDYIRYYYIISSNNAKKNDIKDVKRFH